jgi:hypothetical protein
MAEFFVAAVPVHDPAVSASLVDDTAHYFAASVHSYMQAFNAWKYWTVGTPLLPHPQKFEVAEGEQACGDRMDTSIFLRFLAQSLEDTVPLPPVDVPGARSLCWGQHVCTVIWGAPNPLLKSTRLSEFLVSTLCDAEMPVLQNLFDTENLLTQANALRLWTPEALLFCVDLVQHAEPRLWNKQGQAKCDEDTYAQFRAFHHMFMATLYPALPDLQPATIEYSALNDGAEISEFDVVDWCLRKHCADGSHLSTANAHRKRMEDILYNSEIKAPTFFENNGSLFINPLFESEIASALCTTDDMAFLVTTNNADVLEIVYTVKQVTEFAAAHRAEEGHIYNISLPMPQRLQLFEQYRDPMLPLSPQAP